MWEFVAKKVCKLGSKTWIWILIWPAVKRHVQKWPFESQNGFSYLTKTFWTMQWKAIQVYSEGFLSTLVALKPIYISLFVRQKSFVSKGISEENKINIYNVPTLYSFNGLIKHQLEWLNQTTASKTWWLISNDLVKLQLQIDASNKLQPHLDKTSKLLNQLVYFGSIKSPSVLDITVQLQCSDMGPIKMTRSTAHISHNRHNRRWCTFFELMNFLHTERNILAHLEQFRLFCRVLTHFLVYFSGA